MDSFDLSQPPYDAGFERLPNGFRATASTKSDEAWLRVPVATVWTGFIVFWTYGMAVQNGGRDRWFALAGIPFLAVAAWLIGLAAMRIGGRVEVVKDGADGRVFEGVGAIGITRRFQWADLRDVSLHVRPAQGKQPERRYVAVERKNGWIFHFGVLLDDTAREYLLAALREGMRG